MMLSSSFFEILMSLQETRSFEVLYLSTLHTPLSQNMTGGPWSSDVTGVVRGLVTFGDKGALENGAKIDDV